MPFAQWKNFEDCVRDVRENRPEVDDPEAYCAAIKHRVEEAVDTLFEPPPPEQPTPELIAWVQDNVPVIIQPKINGYRAQLHTASGHLYLGKEGTRSTSLSPAFSGWEDDHILDGELVLISENGKPLSREQASEQIRTGIGDARPVLAVFDVLRVEGRDMRNEPLKTRLTILEGVLDGDGNHASVRLLPSIWVDEATESAIKDALKRLTPAPGSDTTAGNRFPGKSEGLMLKRADSPYESGRRTTWAKFRSSLILEARVLEVLPVYGRPQAHTFRIELLDPVLEGYDLVNDTTLITLQQAEPGDTIQLEANRVDLEEGGLIIDSPRVRRRD